ncbi:hypothetical protein AGLY_010332 [Aphis glycines]|uniref:C2H2-type domain-containing protein n=1 Tax=Aphis glycines TaxID=307491 RepID=A0A6G0THY3_APHGL|nr:hypothetical protein AGLY_010332 [Aphis glycines]
MMRKRRKFQILSVADDLATASILDEHLGFTTHKTNAEQFKFTSKQEIKMLNQQMNLYSKSITDNLYKYEKNDRFKNLVNDVRVVSKQFIPCGTVIKTLCGQTCPIPPEEIIMGVNDFLILCSSKSKKDVLFLGPAAYINHCCSYNTVWVPENMCAGIWCAKTIRPINIGDEITADYGDHYFGVHNVGCQCKCCEQRVNIVSTDGSIEISTDNKAMQKRKIEKSMYNKSSDDMSDGSSDDKENLREEVLQPDGNKTCDVCFKTFKHISWKHLITHIISNTHECKLCKKIYSSKSSLKRHMLCHATERQKHECEKCQKSFYYKSDLSYHMKTSHQPNAILKCQKCEKLYKTNKLLKIHYDDVHNQIKKYKCNICGISFGQPIQLFRHREKEKHRDP